ncbi:MAG TPA: tetratricopeptide repeat protein [Patescibacteria group bacterium]
MSYNIIPFIIIILSLAGIFIIVIKKFPHLLAIDVGSIPAEKEKQKKEEIIKKRANRIISGWLSLIIPKIRPLATGIKDILKDFYRKILALEKFYQKKTALSQEEKKDLDSKIRQMLQETDELIKEENYNEAEKKYIEIISWDSKNTGVYKKLADLYYEQKEYKQAKETLEYLIKLDSADAEIYDRLGHIAREQGNLAEAKKDYKKSIALNDKTAHYHFDLGEINLVMGDYQAALENLKKATDLESNNPKYLDKLIEIYILLKERGQALDTLKTLKGVNPENQKIADFEERIRAI